MKRDDSVKNNDGIDIDKNTTAQDVTVIDEDVNDIEDDSGSTKEKVSDGFPKDEQEVEDKDEQVVEDKEESLNQVAPEDPVETSTEI